MRRLLVALGLAVLAGCSSSPSPRAADVPSTTGESASTTTSAPTRPAVGAATTPYEKAVDGAVRRGLQVSLDGDLAKRWLQSRDRFDEGVRKLAALAARPGVDGIRIADELGYKDGFDNDPTRVRSFLDEAGRALRAAAPGHPIHIDIYVPELGCAPGVPEVARQSAACRSQARESVPAMALEQIDAMVASGSVDVIDLSTGLDVEEVYSRWGITRARAQEAAWDEVQRRGWAKRVLLHARRALAHPGSYSGTTAQAEADVHDFVDLPRRAGAQAVDIWTWRQLYKGEIYRLTDPDLKSNPLVDAIRARKAAGTPLITFFTPSSVERGLDDDLDAMAGVFSGVFVAAGIG